LKIGINVPQFGLFPSSDDTSVLLNFVENAERLGYDSIWAQDKCFQKQISFIDPLTSLAFAAARTKRIELGVATIILPLKDPVMLAKIASDIDVLSNDRLILGVALGNSQDYATSRVPIGERVPRFLEALKVIRLLCTSDDVNFDGKYFRLANASINPRPRRKNGFPIWFGGGVKPALRRAARYGDGWIGAGSKDVSSFKEARSIYEKYLEEFGKGSKSSVAKRIYIHVDRDKEKARQVLKKILSAAYEMEFDVNRLCIFGSPEECASQLREVLLPSGEGTIILNSVADYLEQEEILMNDVVPKIK
jgi:alkanesulfonate monooxygenase SsuD/methylene tetrahydromethanopterin reductase-like flavin-dependent oxidoreductase (luciferase family)